MVVASLDSGVTQVSIAAGGFDRTLLCIFCLSHIRLSPAASGFGNVAMPIRLNGANNGV